MKYKTLFRLLLVTVIGGAFLLTSLSVSASPPETHAVRPAAKAGSWYPANAIALEEMIDGFLDRAPTDSEPDKTAIHALIVPHAAYPYSGATAAVAYSRLKGRHYQRVILLGPAHMARDHQGLFILDVDSYKTPLGRIPLDREAIARLHQSIEIHENPFLHRHEHSLEIQLPFLQRVLKPGWQLVPILISSMEKTDYQEAVKALKPLLDERTLLVVSTDFTHYGARFHYTPFPVDNRIAGRLRDLDMGAFARISAKDPEGFLEYRNKTGITACGYRAVVLLLHLLPQDAEVELLKYATSGKLTGDFSHSVSYIAAMMTGKEKQTDSSIAPGK